LQKPKGSAIAVSQHTFLRRRDGRELKRLMSSRNKAIAWQRDEHKAVRDLWRANATDRGIRDLTPLLALFAELEFNSQQLQRLCGYLLRPMP